MITVINIDRHGNPIGDLSSVVIRMDDFPVVAQVVQSLIAEPAEASA